MAFEAFDLIKNALAEELKTQGFSDSVPLESEEGQAVMYSTGEVAYSLLYDTKRQRFVLRSAVIVDDSNPGEWRNLSLWLFDEKEGTRDDAESIKNDFLEVVSGAKRVEIVQQKKKQGKDGDRSVDPLFFANRLVGIFPELRDDMDNERITYGQIRFVSFFREHVVPKVEDFVNKYGDSDACDKLCSLLDDMYKDGDMDLRSIITIVLLNGLSDGAFSAVNKKFDRELKRASDCSRKLKGKQFKPEKKKKTEKVVSKLG